MPVLTSCLFCDRIENISAPNGMQMSAVNPVHVFVLPFIPGQFSFAILVGIRDIDLSTSNNIRIELIDQSGRVINDTGVIELPGRSESIGVPSEEQGIYFGLDMRNVIINQDGMHYARITFNNTELGRSVVFIKRGDAVAK